MRQMRQYDRSALTTLIEIVMKETLVIALLNYHRA